MQYKHAVFRRLRGASLGLGALALALGSVLTPAGAAQAAHLSAPSALSAQQPAQLSRQVTSTCSADFSEGDRRLGPATLPNSGTVGWELKGYKRTGGLTSAEFLAQYYDASANSWIYPPQNGYQVRADGSPIIWRKTLAVGRELDRFGSEYGAS